MGSAYSEIELKKMLVEWHQLSTYLPDTFIQADSISASSFILEVMNTLMRGTLLKIHAEMDRAAQSLHLQPRCRHNGQFVALLEKYAPIMRKRELKAPK